MNARDGDPLDVQQLADHGIETAAWGYRAGYAAREAEAEKDVPLAIAVIGVAFVAGVALGFCAGWVAR